MTAHTWHCTVHRIVFVAALVTSASADAQAPLHFHELIDMNQTRDQTWSDSSSPACFTEFHERVYFRANDGIHGNEWWVTDGTEAGTQLFYELEPGLSSAGGCWAFEVADRWCFVGPSGSRDIQFWCTESTLPTTRPAFEIRRPERGLSTSRSYSARNLTYLVLRPNGGDYQIWRTDGTTPGTWLCRDLGPGIYPWEEDTFVLDDQLYFCAFNSSGYKSLWVSDGSVTGTLEIGPFTPGEPGLCTSNGTDRHFGPQVLGERIVFSCDESWRNVSIPPHLCLATSPTSGFEVIVRNVYPRHALVDPDHGQAFFWGWDGQTYQVWRTDGTSTGTYQLTSLPEDYQLLRFTDSPGLWLLNGKLLFRVSAPGSSPPYPQQELWVANPETGSSGPVVISDSVHVWGVAGEFAYLPIGSDLWVTDGTTNGTRRIAEDTHAGPGVALGDTYIFSGFEQTRQDAELWRSDGSAEGTQLLKEIRSENYSSDPHDFFRVGHRVVFTADDGVHGEEPWITDGTSDGTLLLGDTNPESGPPRITPASLDDGLLGCGGGRLWSSDGSAHSLAPWDIDVTCSSTPVMLGPRHLFVGHQGGFRGLWTTDGTPGGTAQVATFAPGGSYTGQPIVALDKIFVEVDDGLWVSDGTEDGTRQVFTGTQLSVLSLFGEVGGRMLLAGSDAEHGIELWGTDGTQEGTFLVRDINPGVGSLYSMGYVPPDSWAIIDDRLYFAAFDPVAGVEPWVSDGTTEGTRLLADLGLPNDSIQSQDRNSDPKHFLPVGDRVSFVTSNSQSMFVTTDGTPAGTRVEWRTGDSHRLPVTDTTIAHRGKLLFWRERNSDLGIQRGVWESDGTARGTRLIARLDSSVSLGNPPQYGPNFAITSDDLVVFCGESAVNGKELWVAEPVGPRQPAGRTP